MHTDVTHLKNVDIHNNYIFDYEKQMDRIGNEAVFGVWWNITADFN